MSSSKGFVAGDLVLVNFPGDGYWPSKIVSQRVSSADYKSGWRKIVCFGGNEEGGAYTKDMKPYDEEDKMKYISIKTFKKSLALKKAVKQISMESQNRRVGGTEKEILPAKEKKNWNKAKNMSKLKKKEVMDDLEEQDTVEYEKNATKKNTDTENINKIVTKVNKQRKENYESEFKLVEDEDHAKLRNVDKAEESNMEESNKNVGKAEESNENIDKPEESNMEESNENIDKAEESNMEESNENIDRAEEFNMEESNENVDKAKEYNMEESNENVDKAQESNKEQSNGNISSEEESFNYEIKVENDISDITEDTENTTPVMPQSCGETQSQEQEVAGNVCPSSSKTIRKDKSSGTSQPNNLHCTHDPCGDRNNDENTKITMTIQMSEGTFARIAPMLPDSIRVQYHVTAASNSQQASPGEN